MAIDFSKLEAIAAEAPPEAPQSAGTEEKGNYTPTGETTPEIDTQRGAADEQQLAETLARIRKATGTEGRQAVRADRIQADIARAREVYSAYQQNIQKSELLRAEIAKGAKAGEDPGSLLLLAVDCIAAMTGDGVFSASVKKNLEANKSVTIL